MFDKIKTATKNGLARAKKFAKENQVSVGIIIGGVAVTGFSVLYDANLAKKRKEAWDALDELTLTEYGPYATAFVTREGRTGAIWPIEPDQAVVEFNK